MASDKDVARPQCSEAVNHYGVTFACLGASLKKLNMKQEALSGFSASGRERDSSRSPQDSGFSVHFGSRFSRKREKRRQAKLITLNSIYRLHNTNTKHRTKGGFHSFLDSICTFSITSKGYFNQYFFSFRVNYLIINRTKIVSKHPVIKINE